MELRKNLNLEGARLIFRNFSGKPGRFNTEGNRVFNVLIETELANELISDGWNIRWLEPKDRYEERQAILEVKVKFDKYPPKIVLIKSVGKSFLTEDDVHILDWAEFENVDLIVRPYNWEVNGKTGVSAYLKTMYATLVEDEFEKKYRNVPDSAQSAKLTADDDPPF